MVDTRPNPVSKAAETSNLPRNARARIGQTTDPVPEGKVAHTEPEHHFPIEPAGHDMERTHPKTAEELGLEPHELQKVQRPTRDHVDMKPGMDWMGTATQPNKDMPSAQRRT